MLDIEPSDLIRRSESDYKALDLANRQLSREDALKITVENPKLIERPIVVKDEQAIVGRPPANVHTLLD